MSHISKPGRAAVICPRFSENGTVGGAETLLRQIAERMALAGWQVSILTTCATDHFTWTNVLPPGQRKCGNLDVIFFPVNEDRDAGLFLKIQQKINHRRSLSPEEETAWISNSVNSRALSDHLRKHGSEYDRIITGPYLFGVTYFSAQIFPEKTMLIPCLHDEPFAYLNIMAKMFSSVARCLFNTEPERDLAIRLYKLDESRCSVVGMGLEPFSADPEVFAARHELANPYIIYSGRREEAKGTPLITEYMHTFRQRTGKQIDLVFTGSGRIDAPDGLRPAIHDLGFVSETEKHEAMAGAVAFIHPSVFESLGIVILESFLAKTPALVHARSPVLQWQCRRSGAGLWFRNYPEFEEELSLLADNEDLRRKMGASGRRFVEKEYAWPVVEKRLFEAINK